MISLVSLRTHLINYIVNASVVALPRSAGSFEVVVLEHEHAGAVDHEQIVKAIDDGSLVESEGEIVYGSAVIAGAVFHLVFADLAKMLVRCRIGAVDGF